MSDLSLVEMFIRLIYYCLSLIAPRLHKVQASASDQVRAHEYALYEIDAFYQLTVIRVIFCPKSRLPVPQGKLTTSSIVVSNNVTYFFPYAQCYSEGAWISELGTCIELTK